MNGFLGEHGEKIALAIGIAVLAFSVYSNRGAFMGSPVSAQLGKNLETLRDAMRDNPAEETNPPDFVHRVSEHVSPELPRELHSVEPRKFWPLPPKPKVVRGDVGGVYQTAFPSPEQLEAQPERGRVCLSWTTGAEMTYIKLLTFEVFRSRKQDDFGEKPTAMVEIEWVSPEETREETEATGGTFVRGAGGREGEEARRETYDWTDEDVAPKTVYYYRLRATGAADIKHIKSIQEGKMLTEEPQIFPPDDIDPVIRTGDQGTAVWVTKYSGTVSAKTPADVRLAYKMIMGRPPDCRVRLAVFKWNKGTSEWEEYDAFVGIGDRIVGVRTTLEKGRVQFDSGYEIVNVERVEEPTWQIKWELQQQPDGSFKRVKVRVPGPPKIVYIITVRDVETGREMVIRSDSKEEVEEGAESSGRAVEEAPAEGPRRERGGGEGILLRRRGAD